jgi:hypothetical protein
MGFRLQYIVPAAAMLAVSFEAANVCARGRGGGGRGCVRKLLLTCRIALRREEVRFKSNAGTSLWKRFKVRVLRWLPIEWLL